MNDKAKKDIKNCACDLWHCALAGTAIVGACYLTCFITKYDTGGIFYETFGCATCVVAGGSIIIGRSIYNLQKHIKEYKQHTKEQYNGERKY